MSKKVKVQSGATAPAELRGKIFSDGGAVEGSVLTSATPDQTARWQQGERLDQLFEDRCDRLRDEGLGGQIAVDAGDVVLSYAELDARANQLARHLLACGARPGDRIA
ncbi:MAG TPA: AMP-binding protein, partial [Arthrobacter sp.]|nr:AMP-binding protein [Arthrobacter sp.]